VQGARGPAGRADRPDPRQNVKLIAWFVEHGVDFPALGHPTTKSGAPSLDGDCAAADGRLRPGDEARQVVDLLLAYKEQLNTMAKAEEIIGLVDDSFDGRLHPSVDALGAITARMTSAAPNVQNYAKADPRMRATLLPDEGHTLIGADFDTVELRVLAALAQEETMLATIHSGGDLHQLTADKIGVDRQVGKRVNFLQAYGGGATPLAKATGISTDDALAATRAYREAYPAVAVYSRKLQEASEVRTLTHRRIPATYVSRDGEREAATVPVPELHDPEQLARPAGRGPAPAGRAGHGRDALGAHPRRADPAGAHRAPPGVHGRPGGGDAHDACSVCRSPRRRWP
jgi:hypothetical protein